MGTSILHVAPVLDGRGSLPTETFRGILRGGGGGDVDEGIPGLGGGTGGSGILVGKFVKGEGGDTTYEGITGVLDKVDVHDPGEDVVGYGWVGQTQGGTDFFGLFLKA